MISSAALVAVVSLLSAAPVALAQTCTPCEDVHFFLARGNNEPYPGRQGDLVAATCDGLSSCGYENLIYSALYTDLSCQTTYDGVIAGFTQLTSYAERCPKSKLILAGYSQGAQIVTDILGGGGGESFNGCIQPNTPPLDPTTSPGNRLSAVLTFGNTRHTANQPYNYGNGSGIDGLFPRSGDMLTALDKYTAVTRDWCLQTDPICAANQTDSLVSTHLGYYNMYSDEAAAWIKSVAGLVDNSDFTTAIPTYVSGTVQDYSTVGTATPSGSVSTVATTTPSIICGGSSTTPVIAALTSANATATSSGSLITSKPHANSTMSTAAITSGPSFIFGGPDTTTASATVSGGASSTNSVAIQSQTGAANSNNKVGSFGLTALLLPLLGALAM
ncbi:hypothetical protein LTS17_009983 [Exophiala oligosperma]